ncbi:MAG: hypothetical protein ACK5O7_06385 [Holosporales bacterium]
MRWVVVLFLICHLQGAAHATEYTWFFENPDAQSEPKRQCILGRVLQGVGAATVVGEALHHYSKPLAPQKSDPAFVNQTPQEWQGALRSYRHDLSLNRTLCYRRSFLAVVGFYALKMAYDVKTCMEKEDALFRLTMKKTK